MFIFEDSDSTELAEVLPRRRLPEFQTTGRSREDEDDGGGRLHRLKIVFAGYIELWRGTY